MVKQRLAATKAMSLRTVAEVVGRVKCHAVAGVDSWMIE